MQFNLARMPNWTLLVMVFFTMVIDQGRSDAATKNADDSDSPQVLERNYTFLDDHVHINNAIKDDLISVSVNTTGNDEMQNPIEQNNSENNGSNGAIMDRQVRIDDKLLIVSDDKNFQTNDLEKISNIDELVELIDSENNVKINEVESIVNAKMKEIEILSEERAIEPYESELDNLDNFPSHGTYSKHSEIIIVQEENTFPDVAANEMLVLLDDKIDIFEEMKKKVNLLEMQMRKNEDLHLYHQGIVGKIEAAEIILSTLTPFEENLEAVKEYIIKLDHHLDNSTADFVIKFVVSADNFLKKAQQSLEIVQYENVEKWKSADNLLTVENKTKESGNFESTYSHDNSHAKSIPNGRNIISENDHENSMYEPIIQSSMAESELKKYEMDLSPSANEEDNAVPSGIDSLTQDYIKPLQNIEDHDVTEGINGVKDMNDDKVDSTEIKGSITNANEAIEEDLIRKLNPKFKHLFEKEQIHRHAHENIKSGGKEEIEDGGWMAGMGLFSLLISGLLVVILVCWMVGKIVLRSSSYKRLNSSNYYGHASHRNC